ncbi:hypothetical protein DC522_03255 [Microvirga sp. KLBC 81]|uniref:hypothetical protein n=1 Tax=Microvirga sp. KLBC 81 TaxID=1862707 RepID=UPI000D50861F|nr:hypothetical protein [Microvirga sp. KLBC 81]PVE25805.1 hypothetical protein DC522_03255 [Microvirga sp. KLBC 81]
MREQASVSLDGSRLQVHLPLRFRRRGGRKLVVAPPGEGAWIAPRARIDNSMVKALARAFRWRRMLESGAYSTIEELARAERINPSYVCRILRLTLLAPDIVEAILDGRQPEELQLERLLRPFPVDWPAQRDLLLAV